MSRIHSVIVSITSEVSNKMESGKYCIQCVTYFSNLYSFKVEVRQPFGDAMYSVAAAAALTGEIGIPESEENSSDNLVESSTSASNQVSSQGCSRVFIIKGMLFFYLF